MHLTSDAVGALTKGAEADCLDINAITTTGGESSRKFYACQYIWEEEQFQHLRQPFPEYQPVLEVQQIHWLGTRRRIPVIRLVVTDGVQSMEMRPSLRSEYVQRRNFKKLGHLFRGKLNVGKRFTLLEYTTDMIECSLTLNSIPTIFYEDTRAQPQRKNMKSLNREHAKQMNEKENTSNLNVLEKKPKGITYDQAVKEMEGQLQRLKIHRSRLGY
jgi:hypothetical protein